MSDIPEFRVKVTIRNNLLLSAIEGAGYVGWGGLSRFCRENATVVQSQLSALLSMREAPITSEGEFSVTAKAVMEALGAAPSDLWTEEQLTMKLARNTSEARMTSAGVRALLESHNEQMTLQDPEDAVGESMSCAMVRSVIATLTPREEKVLCYRFGIGQVADHTLDECSAVFGVTRERIRQIEARALRKLRHPDRSDLLNGMGSVRAEAAQRERERERDLRKADFEAMFGRSL